MHWREQRPVPERSLGQLTYEAYWLKWPARPLPWERLSLRERQAWDAAARTAVAVGLARLGTEDTA